MSAEWMDLATRVVARARELGADEVSVSVSSGRHVTLSRRERRVEQATEATTRGLVLSVLAGDRFTSNSTSDLRPDALDAFVRRSVSSAGWLEPDPYRRQPERSRCGRGVSEAQLDQSDPAWAARTAADRATQCEQLEELVRAAGEAAGGGIVSCSASVADGWSEGVRVMSNGFADRSEGAWFSASADMTLAEGDKRPEGSAYYGVRHLADLPSDATIAAECVKNTRERLGSGSIASGTYPMLLENRVAGRVLGMLGAPLSGGSLHEGRSCLQGKLGAVIASDRLTIVDDPTIPRGLGSRPWDGDALVAKVMPVVERGVLQNYYVSQYYARKLGMEPSTGGKSNWVVAPGARSFAEIARDLPKAIQVTGFLGGNANSTTGDFSFGIRGLLLEHGEVTASLSEMNVGGNLLKLLQSLAEVGNDPWVYASTRAPSLLFSDVRFSGS
ncbi:MAG: TldD/PmbA family protein [Myxococcota bacterium]